MPTNQNGLLSLIIGGEADWDDIDWLHSKIAVVITLPDLSVVKDTTEVNAVPLAINTMYSATVDPSSLVQSNWTQADTEDPSFILNKPSIKDTVNNILTTDGYVTTNTLDGRHYLTSDSAVITTMQSDIATNRTNISTNATNIQTNTTNIDNLIRHTAKAAFATAWPARSTTAFPILRPKPIPTTIRLSLIPIRRQKPIWLTLLLRVTRTPTPTF